MFIPLNLERAALLPARSLERTSRQTEKREQSARPSRSAASLEARTRRIGTTAHLPGERAPGLDAVAMSRAAGKSEEVPPVSIVHPLPARAVPPERAALLAARLFMDVHGEAVTRAAELIAGPREGARARGLLGAVGRAATLTPALRREIERLQALLSLQLDPAHGADIEPIDPVVHELCLVADAVGDLLAALAAPALEPAAPAAALDDAVPRPPRRALG